MAYTARTEKEGGYTGHFRIPPEQLRYSPDPFPA